MMKFSVIKAWIVLFSLVFFNGFAVNCFASGLPSGNYSKIAATVLPAVVTVIVYDYSGNIKNIGSGFFYNKNGDILTNNHVLSKNTRAEIKTRSGKTYAVGSIIKRNEKTDIVQARTHFSGEAPFLKIAKGFPRVGHRIMVAGSPMGLEQTITEGIVSAWRKIPDRGRVLQISAPISPGSSGGPVLNMAGEVVGLATFQMVRGQNLNFAVPVDTVLNNPHIDTKLKFHKNQKGVIVIE
jgi:serine protease Do